jgi:hypothetical protein
MKVHWWRDTRFQRFMPASHAKTPTIAFLQSGEAILRCYQVVTAGIGEFEEFVRHLSADRMETAIARTSSAVSVSIKPSERITATAAQLSTKNICWHGQNIACVTTPTTFRQPTATPPYGSTRSRVRRSSLDRSKRWDESAYSRTRTTTRTRTIKTERRPYNAVSTRLRHGALFWGTTSRAPLIHRSGQATLLFIGATQRTYPSPESNR